MEQARHSLLYHWTLVVHSGCKVYASDNEYLILDWDGDMLVQLTVHEDIVAATKSAWHLQYYIDIHRKEIVITNEPLEA